MFYGILRGRAGWILRTGQVVPSGHGQTGVFPKSMKWPLFAPKV